MKKMTNEKAKECIDAIIGTWEICQNQKYLSAVDVEIDAEDIVALKMAIEALEQQPCEDAISRQATLEPYKVLNDTDTLCVALIRANIMQQPPVTPQQKVGMWIKKGQDIYCSICNNESAYNPFGASKFSKYCPNCGSLMQAE